MIELAVADDTVAFTAPKYTILWALVALKLEPDMVTVVPGAATFGETDVIFGAWLTTVTEELLTVELVQPSL